MIAGAVAICAAAAGVDDASHGMCTSPTFWVYLVSQMLSGIVATITFVSLGDHH